MRQAPLLISAAPRIALADSVCIALLYTAASVTARTPKSSSTATSTSRNGRRRCTAATGSARCRSRATSPAMATSCGFSPPSGLAAAFIIDQPPAERRIKPRTPRDSERLIGDTVVADGGLRREGAGRLRIHRRRSAAAFATASSPTRTNSIATGTARGSTPCARPRSQWFVELFIPWSSISMRESARRDAHHRRVWHALSVTSAANAMPARASPAKRRCSSPISSASRFRSTSRRRASTSCLTARRSPISSTNIRDFKAGADINWKVSPNLWLAATLNPDFGQVESDELVVDFSAIETVFTDKRPFFTENQGIFDLRTPANGQLVYTRRIGAATGRWQQRPLRTSTPQLKLTGTAGSVVYGGFVAQEDDYRSRMSAACSRRPAPLLPLRACALRLSGHVDRSPVAGSRRAGQCGRLRTHAERELAHQRPAHPLRYRHQRRRCTGSSARTDPVAKSTRTATSRGCRPTSIAARR